MASSLCKEAVIKVIDGAIVNCRGGADALILITSAQLMECPMSAVRAVFASFGVIAVTAGVVAAVSIAAPAGAADAVTVEAESMRFAPASAAAAVRDATASAGAALVMRSTATASVTLSLPAAVGIVVRAKGQQCNGAPTMNVVVDGNAVSTTKVSSSQWTNYTTSRTIAAGPHTISVTYPNPYRLFLCTRTLSLDRVSVIANAATTTSTPTSVPTSTTPPSTTAPPSVPSGDATAWLQSRFDALKPGETLTLQPGVYQHSGVLKMRVAGARINGDGATLQATSDPTSAVQILADNVAISNMILAAPLTGTRYTTADQTKLLVAANGVSVSDVTVTGSASAGISVVGATNFRLDRVTVRNSRADGIHITRGANNGQVNNAVTEWSGDDGIAVVSYGGEPSCHDIVINSPTVTGTTWGRGISVVGGQNISYRNISVTQSSAAGVYVATEGNPWNTGAVSKVDVTGGTVDGANTSTEVIHGAVLVYSGNSKQSVRDVTISGLTIANTPTTATRNVGILVEGGAVSGISLTDISLQNTRLTPLVKYKVPAGSYTASGWTLDGRPISVQ